MIKITLGSTVCQSDDQVSTEIDDEVVLMSIEKGAYFGLNNVLSRIWKMLEEPVAVSKICETLQEDFDVEREVCEKDVVEALQQLAEKELIVAS